MISAKKYSPDQSENWNNFVANSKNGTFLFNRDYMDYHKDKFEDFSIMFYEKNELIAILPASKHDQELKSHGGLTYGGVISSRKMTASKMIEVFDILKAFLQENNISKLLYKCVPKIYHSYSSDEDLYALFINNAKLVRRDISSAIYLPNKIKFSKGKKWGISKAKQAEVIVKQFFDFKTFIGCENKLLEEKHQTKAIHSGEEIELLATRFPENIKMFGGFIDSEFLGGTILFETTETAHTQYITTTDKGREFMALELVMDYLINEHYKDKKYFDFGISTEQGGRFLNHGLISQKEMFGARGVVYDFYELEV